jgi:uncharacterized GH25 family protein
MQLVIPRILLVLVVVVAAFQAGPAQAHDYWMKADTKAAVRPGEDVDIRMWVGDKLDRAEEDEHNEKKARAFVHVSAKGSTDLGGKTRDGATPIIVLKSLASGGHLVAMTRSRSHITLPGWKFSTYLFTEEFKQVASARKDSGATWSAGRERYSRYLKTLIQVGSSRNKVYGTVLGQKYEIILQADPMALRAGESLPVQVQFRGKPAIGVRVVARSAEHKSSEGRTDASGLVSLPLSGRGEWLIRSVHMQSCVGCKKADWESFWASYHFIQH